jgi:hypothetical protein
MLASLVTFTLCAGIWCGALHHITHDFYFITCIMKGEIQGVAGKKWESLLANTLLLCMSTTFILGCNLFLPVLISFYFIAVGYAFINIEIVVFKIINDLTNISRFFLAISCTMCTQLPSFSHTPHFRILVPAFKNSHPATASVLVQFSLPLHKLVL